MRNHFESFTNPRGSGIRRSSFASRGPSDAGEYRRESPDPLDDLWNGEPHRLRELLDNSNDLRADGNQGRRAKESPRRDAGESRGQAAGLDRCEKLAGRIGGSARLSGFAPRREERTAEASTKRPHRPR